MRARSSVSIHDTRTPVVVLFEPAADPLSYESKFLPLLETHLDPALFRPFVVGSAGLKSQLGSNRYGVLEVPLGYLGHRGFVRFASYVGWLLLSSLFVVKGIKCSRSRVLLSMMGHCYTGFVIALVGKITLRTSIVRISEPTRALLQRNRRPFLAYALACWTERLSLSLSTSVFSVRDMSDYFGRPISKSQVISQGVNIERAASARRSSLLLAFSPVVVSVSRLDSEKGIDRLIDSMSYLVGKYPKIGCVIVGWGPEFENLVRKVSGLPEPARFKFTGYVSPDKVASVLKACDVFVLPSELEGVPSAVLEAMASGLPVVMCIRTGSFAESVKNAKAGLIVSPDPRAIAEGIQTLLDNPKLRAAVSESGLNYVRRNFDYKDSQKMMSKLILGLANS